MGTSSLYDLTMRANVLLTDVNDRDVLVYEDHRYLLFVTWYAAYKRIITPPINLVYFDKHDDLSPLSAEAMGKVKTLISSTDARQILSFVEWELNGLDSDWLKAMMELGLIGDAVLIGAVNPENLEDDEHEYTDHKGTKHVVYSVPHLWSSLSHKGALSDKAISYRYSKIWGVIGWNPSQYPNGLSDEQILLDFDLDCFTYEPAEWIGMRAWDREILDKMLSEESKSPYTTGWTGYRFLRGLLRKTPYITIAKESYYCGGTRQSEDALQNLLSALRYTEL